MNTQSIQINENNAQNSEWDAAVGGFFRAFAMIEFLSMQFVTKMADPAKYKSIKKKFLSQKLVWIIDTLHEQTASSPEKVQEVIEVLESIREESYFRNVLAHGAAGLSFSKTDANASPDLVGVLNFKPEDEDQDAEMISLEEIQGRRDTSMALAKSLVDHLNQLEFLPTPESPKQL